MRKTFKRPDGTDVTVEGTPEELAKYERALQINEKAEPKKPGILKGAEQPISDELRKLLEQIQNPSPPYPDPYDPYRPIWVGGMPCWLCGMGGCEGRHNVTIG